MNFLHLALSPASQDFSKIYSKSPKSTETQKYFLISHTLATSNYWHYGLSLRITCSISHISNKQSYITLPLENRLYMTYLVHTLTKSHFNLMNKIKLSHYLILSYRISRLQKEICEIMNNVTKETFLNFHQQISLTLNQLVFSFHVNLTITCLFFLYHN